METPPALLDTPELEIVLGDLVRDGQEEGNLAPDEGDRVHAAGAHHLREIDEE